MKSWFPLVLVNGMILAVTARVAEVTWHEKSLAPLYLYPIAVALWLLGGNCKCIRGYRRALLRSEAFRRRVERKQIYSEPYTWFRRDPNPEPLRNLEGRWKAVGR